MKQSTFFLFGAVLQTNSQHGNTMTRFALSKKEMLYSMDTIDRQGQEEGC